MKVTPRRKHRRIKVPRGSEALRLQKNTADRLRYFRAGDQGGLEGNAPPIIKRQRGPSTAQKNTAE